MKILKHEIEGSRIIINAGLLNPYYDPCQEQGCLANSGVVAARGRKGPVKIRQRYQLALLSKFALPHALAKLLKRKGD